MEAWKGSRRSVMLVASLWAAEPALSCDCSVGGHWGVKTASASRVIVWSGEIWMVPSEGSLKGAQC